MIKSKGILLQMLKRFRVNISFTALLVIAESLTTVLFPLFMGFAINGLLEKNFTGMYSLIGLGVTSLIIGSGRRFYDTRTYSKIYAVISPELVEQEMDKGSSVSVITARTNLLTEFVEFLEDSMPQIINSFIGLFGTLFIIFTLNKAVFIACLITLTLTIIVYLLSSNYTFKLNKGFNDELEKQVKVIEAGNKPGIINHFKNVMRWNIRLSDLETINFSIVWLFMIALLSYSIITVLGSGVVLYGTIFSIIMYVFEYISSVTYLPLYYQQLVRLKEISGRLKF